MKQLLAAVCLFACAACGSSSPSSPSATPAASSTPAVASTPTPAPAASTFSLSGTISFSGLGSGIPSASVTILDGPNAGRTTQTDTSGAYTFSGLTSAGFNVQISASGFVSVTRGVNLGSNVTLSVALLPSAVWTQSGFGNNVFAIPGYVTKIHVTGHFVDTGSNSNFIVSVNGSTLINEILRQKDYDGVHLVAAGGTVQITSSGSIQWTFTELR